MSPMIQKMGYFLLFTVFSFLSNAAPQPYAFEGKDVLTGITHKVTAQKTVILFVSAKCPCSHSHMKEVSELSRLYPDFKFFGVHSNMDEDEALTKTYFSKINLPFPVLQDDGTKTADHFKALKTPHAFLLNEKGETIYQGGVSDSKDCEGAGRLYLREALEDVKNKREIKTPIERSLGCAITRRKR